MALLVSDIVARIKYAEPSIDDVTALRYVNRVNSEIHERFVIAQDELLIPVIADTPVYSLSSEVGKVLTAQYYLSAGSYITLVPASFERLDEHFPRWREWKGGVPRWYYLQYSSASVPQIGIAPMPIQSASGGYPAIRVWYAKVPDDLAMDSGIPEAVSRDGDIYVTGALCYWARDTVHRTYPIRRNDYEYELARLERMLQRRHFRSTPVIKPKTKRR